MFETLQIKQNKNTLNSRPVTENVNCSYEHLIKLQYIYKIKK